MQFRQSDIGVLTGETTWGWVGIAWSARGLARVTLPQPSEGDVLRQLPAAAKARPEPPPGLDPALLLEKLRRYVDGEDVVFDEPLDPAIGGEFQRTVWALCRVIPRGQTSTYGELARQAGSPAASRAVGQAMARNPWPIVVPCHRVLGSNGRLTGFGGGLEMKRAMLLMEGGLLA
jgi:methylated-DNA-[protein]-cysteine S-methyltransferase